MIIGISVELPNSSGRYLEKLFEKIDIDKYVWAVSDDEVLYIEDNMQKKSLFSSNVVHGADVKRRVSIDEYYLVFLDIKGFNNIDDIIEIETYDEFVKSKCEIVMLCSDSSYVDIYCKNTNDLLSIVSNCNKHNFAYEAIDENNNLRTKMSVF